MCRARRPWRALRVTRRPTSACISCSARVGLRHTARARNRKAAIALLLERTPDQDRAELAVLEAARGVEEQRRAEAAARRAAQPPGARPVTQGVVRQSAPYGGLRRAARGAAAGRAPSGSGLLRLAVGVG